MTTEKTDKTLESLLGTAMEKLNDMVNVNTVVGEPILAGDTTIIPISKVTLGFAVGGGEYGEGKNDKDLAFGGASSGGMRIQPVGFLSCTDGQVRFLPIGGQDPVDKILDMAPGIIDKVDGIIRKEK